MILKTLHALGPQHGFGIARRIEQVSRDVLQLNEGTVYTSLLRLQQAGMDCLRSGGMSDNNRKAKFYSITARGEKQLAVETENWERISGVWGVCCDWKRRDSHGERAGFRGCVRLRQECAGSSGHEGGIRILTKVHRACAIADGSFCGARNVEEDAAAAARRQFGNTTLLQKTDGNWRTLVSVEDLWRDVRYALRSLGRSRGFAAVAIATLGLGIGASTAIFSVIDNVVLEPFPYKDAGRMVFPRIHDTARGQEGERQGYTSNELSGICRAEPGV